MEHEIQRLASFNRATWPHSGSSLTPERLAAAGFFASPTPKAPDRVVCFACENALTNWDPTDDPWIEHKTWYPACPFVQGKSTGNVPIHKVPTSSLQILPKNNPRDRPVLRAGQVEILVNDAAHASEAPSGADANGVDRGGDGGRAGLNSYIQNLKSTSSKEELTDEVPPPPVAGRYPVPRSAKRPAAAFCARRGGRSSFRPDARRRAGGAGAGGGTSGGGRSIGRGGGCPGRRAGC